MSVLNSDLYDKCVNCRTGSCGTGEEPLSQTRELSKIRGEEATPQPPPELAAVHQAGVRWLVHCGMH